MGIWDKLLGAFRPKSANNVTRIDFKRKKKGSQPCSMCSNKVDKLTFYVNETGQVIGVCKNCVKRAKARDLDPI